MAPEANTLDNARDMLMVSYPSQDYDGTDYCLCPAQRLGQIPIVPPPNEFKIVSRGYEKPEFLRKDLTIERSSLKDFLCARVIDFQCEAAFIDLLHRVNERRLHDGFHFDGTTDHFPGGCAGYAGGKIYTPIEKEKPARFEYATHTVEKGNESGCVPNFYQGTK